MENIQENHAPQPQHTQLVSDRAAVRHAAEILESAVRQLNNGEPIRPHTGFHLEFTRIAALLKSL